MGAPRDWELVQSRLEQMRQAGKGARAPPPRDPGAFLDDEEVEELLDWDWTVAVTVSHEPPPPTAPPPTCG